MATGAFTLWLFTVGLAIAAGQAMYGRDNLGLLYGYNNGYSNGYNNVYNTLGGQNMPLMTNTVQDLGLGPRQRVYRIRNAGSGLSQRELLYDTSSRLPLSSNSFINNYGLGNSLGRVYDLGLSSVPYDPVGNLIYRSPVNRARNVASILL